MDQMNDGCSAEQCSCGDAWRFETKASSFATFVSTTSFLLLLLLSTFLFASLGSIQLYLKWEEVHFSPPEPLHQNHTLKSWKMLDPVGDGIQSPTNSSVSSSDLDSKSTGSFFHDRSTSLGTLMGVHFPTITFRTPLYSSQSQSQAAAASLGGARKKQSKKMKKKKSLVLGGAAPDKGRKWWSLCRDDDEAKPGSLGEFLEVERRFGEVGGGFYGTEANLDVEGVMAPQNGRGVLFSNGKVLPPVAAAQSPPAVFCGICCTG